MSVLFSCIKLLSAFKITHLVSLLKLLKQLSMDSGTLAPLQKAGAIPKLIALFSQENISTVRLLFSLAQSKANVLYRIWSTSL